MARLYTGQHGEFFFWVQDRLFGDIEGFDISETAAAAGVEHKILNTGRVVVDGNGKATKQQLINQRRQAWESAGWIRANSDDYPRKGDIFVGNGKKAAVSSKYRWTNRRPVARPSIPGRFRRVGTVRNWSFSNTAETIDATTLGDTYRHKLGGLKGITGQAQLMYYRDRDDTDGPISNMLDAFNYQDSETTSGEIQVKFRLQHSASGTRDFEFDALITNFSMACSVGEVVTVDVTFEAMQGPSLRGRTAGLLFDT